MNTDETELIAHILDGDSEQYKTLIDRYKTGLYHHCFCIVRDEDTAEDITQEALVQAFFKLNQYQPQYRFSTWLYKIATNYALAHQRSRRALHLSDEQWERLPSQLASPARGAAYAELYRAIGTLPPHYRSVISLHYWQDRTQEEIAHIMQRPLGTIKTWLRRAKHQLKETIS